MRAMTRICGYAWLNEPLLVGFYGLFLQRISPDQTRMLCLVMMRILCAYFAFSNNECSGEPAQMSSVIVKAGQNICCTHTTQRMSVDEDRVNLDL